MKDLIERGVKNLVLERRIIDKMLKAEEDNNASLLSNISVYFDGLKKSTDNIVDDILRNYDINDVVSYIESHVDFETEESMYYLGLMERIDFRIINSLGEKLYNINTDCFNEEHSRILYLVYIWYIQNNNLSPRVRTSLHNFMTLKLCNSEFIRTYYSGNILDANDISNPDSNFGVATNELASKSYYSSLNKYINDSNCCEMFEGMVDENVVTAKKLLLELDFVALSIQMDDRKIVYPVSIAPVTDYSREVLEKASSVYQDYRSGKVLKIKKPIYL